MGGKNAYNWLLVLGLEFDPAPNDKDVLEGAVKKKLKAAKMNDKQNDPQKGGYYRAIADELGKPDVLQMLQDEEQRAGMAKEACEVVYKLLDEFIKLAARDTREIENGKIVAIAKQTQKNVRKQTGIPDWECASSAVCERAKAQGFIVYEPDQASAGGASTKDEELAAYDPFSKKSKWRSKNWEDLDEALRTFGCATLYEYACPDGYEKNPVLFPSDVLLKGVVGRAREQKQHNAAKSSADRIEGYAQSILDSDDARAEYNEYIEFKAVNDKLELLKDKADINDGQVSDEAFGEAIKEVAGAVCDKSKAPLIVRGFCRKKNLRFPQQQNIAYCRCGHANDPGNQFCQGCGLPLVVTCPSCKKDVMNREEYCTCGEQIGKALGEAVSLCDMAQGAFERFDFAAAQEWLEKARAKWPGLKRCKELGRDIDGAKRDIGPGMERLSRCMKENRFCAARDAYAGLERRHKGFQDAVKAQEICKRISEADGFARRAEAATSEEKKVDLYGRALAACADHPDALQFMRENPPAPPSNLRVAIVTPGNKVRLDWDPSPSGGSLIYLVCRREGSPLASSEDGDEVARGSATWAEDASMRSGEPYYYAVCALRADVPSQLVGLSKPVYITPEVANLRIVPGDGMVEFYWKALDGGEVEIEEKSPGHRSVLRTSSNHAVLPGLDNAATYTYRVRVHYHVEGDDVATEGILASATPIDAEESIVDFRAARSRGAKGRFTLSWTEDPGQKVMLFSAENRDMIPDGGTITSLDELERQFARACVCGQGVGSADFRYEGDTPLFLFPVLVYGKTAVVGNCARVCVEEEIKITDVRRVNDEIAVYIEPLEKASAFIVLCRSDRFVRDIGESGADGDQTRRQIPRKAYERDGALKMKYAGQRDYYISVGVMYGTASAFAYSGLTEYFFSTRPKEAVKYSIRAAKIPFAGLRATLTFSMENQTSFRLPQTVVEYGVGGVPVLPGSGVQVAVIPEQDVEGTLDFRVSGLPNCENVYLKASPSDAASNAYVLDPKSKCKIS